MSYPYLVYETSLRSSQIHLVRDGSNLVLQDTTTGTAVVFTDYFLDGWLQQEIHLNASEGVVLLRTDVDATLANAGAVPLGVDVAAAGVVDGTQFADTLTATGYGSTLDGGASNDRLSAAVDGSVFDVVFRGGLGDDVLTGSYGRDWYQYQLGDGQDVIRDDVRRLGPDVASFFAAHPGTDTYQDHLVFGDLIGPADVTPMRVGSDLVLGLSDGGSITIAGWYDGTMFDKIEHIDFSGFGTSWLASDIDHRLGEASPGITVSGGGTLEGSQYDDSLTATAYGAVLDGGAGNDTLTAAVDGGIFGLDFTGGRGNDTIVGSYAGDVYHYALGDGNDRITDDVFAMGADVTAFFEAHPNTGSYQDKLVFGPGITTGDITLERLNDDMILHVRGKQGSVTVANWYTNGMDQKIESVEFADGTVWLASDLDHRLNQPSVGRTVSGSGVVEGSQYNDSLTASAYGTEMDGGASNDVLQARVDGSVFALVFDGGRGDDLMIGSYGGDTYRYSLGDGRDLVRDDVRALGQGVADFFQANPDAPSYQDDLEFGAGITAGMVTRTRVGTDLVLGVNDPAHAGSVTIQGWFDGTPFNKIELIGFVDGTTWTAAMAEQGLA